MTATFLDIPTLFLATSVQSKGSGHRACAQGRVFYLEGVWGEGQGHQGASSRLHSESRARTSIRLGRHSQHAFS